MAVIGNSRTTYKHRREIKAHGAKWNRETNRWEATDPDDVARLRAWFALREQDEPTATAQNEPQATQSEPTANDDQTTQQAAPLHEAGEITDTTDEPTAAVRYREATPYDSHPAIMLNVYGHRERFTVRSIGCNSFGIEVCLKDKYNCTTWTAIEQLSQSQQQKVISAIDWGTLN